jgi:tRNA pseudouridine55 synthase
VDGILNLNKPRGWTSHDVVAFIRRLTKIRKVGHAGTLDPMATGVLLVCLGRATRIAEYLMAGRKQYRAQVRLGISTDTHDAEGRVMATAPVAVTHSQVRDVLARFVGCIAQVPPMVSALKKGGQPLYKLARQGIQVEREARPVEIYTLALTEFQPPDLTLEITCSPGTYIRALARDLGRELGCGAHLTALTRLASGSFTLDEAIALEDFAAAVEASVGREAAGRPEWQRMVLPLDAGLAHLPVCTLGPEQARRVRTGQALAAAEVDAPRDGLCRAFAREDDAQRLIALLRYDGGTGVWQPHKVFLPL